MVKEYSEQHTKTEQLLHNLAFTPWYPRLPLSNMESSLHKKQLAGISTERPVFITALPRAGTTLLLKLCVETGEFASHAYRDMPFLFTPIFWNRLSHHFRKSSMLTERVHGDGVLVNEDSPESFEEIIWKEFWPSHYKKDRVVPWKALNYPDFEAFFREHMRKIIHLKGNGSNARYVSKNNLNIARISYLSQAFSDATILILFRSPLQQASSLLKQHRNFLVIHQEDPFASKYMEDTGHFDFGDNLRPVDFNGWYSKGKNLDPNTLTFWLTYWTEAYQYLLDQAGDQVRFLSFDAFCENPQKGLKKLAEIINLNDSRSLTSKAEQIRQPKPYSVDANEAPKALLDQAEDVFDRLMKAEN
ncbi:sulfotransferase [Chloroflexota bacterium]|nr:sulfotransferase [Chloroflexota bacterium]